MSDRRVDVPKLRRPSGSTVVEEVEQPPRLDLDISGFSDGNGSTDVIDPEVRAALTKASPDTTADRPKTEPAVTKRKRRKTKSAESKADDKDETKLRRKRNVLLPHRLVPALRDRATDDQVPHGEVVVDAFVNHIDAVRTELTADKGDEERRRKLGLPPRRRRQPRLGDDELERRVQVGLYMPTKAIEVIEEAAGEFGISWSYLVSLLLDRELS